MLEADRTLSSLLAFRTVTNMNEPEVRRVQLPPIICRFLHFSFFGRTKVTFLRRSPAISRYAANNHLNIHLDNDLHQKQAGLKIDRACPRT